MVRAIPVRKLQKIWAVIWADAIFLLFLGCSAELLVLCSGPFSRTTSDFIVLFLYSRFPPGWCVWTASTQALCRLSKKYFVWFATSSLDWPHRGLKSSWGRLVASLKHYVTKYPFMLVKNMVRENCNNSRSSRNIGAFARPSRFSIGELR